MIYDFIKNRLDSATDSLGKAHKAFKNNDYKSFVRESGKLILFYAVIIIIAIIVITTSQTIFNFARNISNNTIAMVGLALVFIVVYVLPRLKLPESLEIPTIAEIMKMSDVLRKTLFFVVEDAFTKTDVDVSSDDKLKLVGSTQYYLKGLTPILLYRMKKGKHCSITAAEVEEILQDEFWQLETNHRLPFSNGEFYQYRGRQFCSVLVMDVKEEPRHFIIELALATDHSCHKWLIQKSSDSSEVSTNDEEI